MGLIFQYPESVCKVLLVLAIAFLGTYCAEKKDSFSLYLFVVIILSLFIGLRSYDTGTDTHEYVTAIRWSQINGMRSYNFEAGFVLISNFIYNIFHSETIVLFTFSFITTLFFLLRFWELRENYNLILLLFGFLTNYYLMSANIIRQILAMSIVFWSTRFIFNKNRPIVFYSIILLTAFLFHTSAIMGIGVMFFSYIFNLKKISIKQLIVLFIGLALISYFTNHLLSSPKFIVLNRYLSDVNDHFSSNLTLIMFCIVFFISYIINEREYFCLKKHNENKNIYHTLGMVVFMGLTTNSFLFSFHAVSRISLYYIMFSMMFYSYKWDNKGVVFFKYVFFSLYSIKILYDALNNGYYGIMPYNFFWEN